MMEPLETITFQQHIVFKLTNQKQETIKINICSLFCSVLSTKPKLDPTLDLIAKYYIGYRSQTLQTAHKAVSESLFCNIIVDHKAGRSSVYVATLINLRSEIIIIVLERLFGSRDI